MVVIRKQWVESMALCMFSTPRHGPRESVIICLFASVPDTSELGRAVSVLPHINFYHW